MGGRYPGGVLGGGAWPIERSPPAERDDTRAGGGRGRAEGGPAGAYPPSFFNMALALRSFCCCSAPPGTSAMSSAAQASAAEPRAIS